MTLTIIKRKLNITVLMIQSLLLKDVDDQTIFFFFGAVEKKRLSFYSRKDP